MGARRPSIVGTTKVGHFLQTETGLMRRLDFNWSDGQKKTIIFSSLLIQVFSNCWHRYGTTDCPVFVAKVCRANWFKWHSSDVCFPCTARFICLHRTRRRGNSWRNRSSNSSFIRPVMRHFWVCIRIYLWWSGVRASNAILLWSIRPYLQCYWVRRHNDSNI